MFVSVKYEGAGNVDIDCTTWLRAPLKMSFLRDSGVSAVPESSWLS